MPAHPFVLFASIAVTLITTFTFPCAITLHQRDFRVIYNLDLSIGIHLTTNDFASGMTVLACWLFDRVILAMCWSQL
jgi:hypothetical protein